MQNDCKHAAFSGTIKTHVIASQCAHWRGNPRKLPESFGDCHVGLRPPRNDVLFSGKAPELSLRGLPFFR